MPSFGEGQGHGEVFALAGCEPGDPQIAVAAVEVIDHDSDAHVTDIHAADVADTEVECTRLVSKAFDRQVAAQRLDAAERVKPQALQSFQTG